MTKTLIITGASSGIGRALAKHLASLGNNVIAVARRKKELEELQSLYPQNIQIVTADITQEEGRIRVKQALPANAAGIYVVHNAGIALANLLGELSEEEWEKHYKINVTAPFLLTKILLPHLKNGGRVLHISTSLAHNPLAGVAAYGTSKAALYMLKEYCNAEFNDQGIYFGSVLPGAVNTPIQEKIRSYGPEQFPSVKTFQDFLKHGELLSPETVSKFITWLLLNVEANQFIADEWNIYDTSHHKHWSLPGEVVQI